MKIEDKIKIPCIFCEEETIHTWNGRLNIKKIYPLDYYSCSKCYRVSSEIQLFLNFIEYNYLYSNNKKWIKKE